MLNLFNPRWLFIVNTLPITVLFILLFGQFNIIKTLLNENTIQLWITFGLALGILWLLNFAYAIYLTLKKQNVSVFYGAVALLCYIPFIYIYAWHSGKIIPFSVPQWMISGNMFLYVGTFLMPTLAYSLFILTAHFTPETKTHKGWVNFLIAIAIPVAGYLFSQITLPLWRVVDNDFWIHVLLILIIAANLGFLFFLLRGVFILATGKTAVLGKYQLVWKIPIAIALPLLGLLINNGALFSPFDLKMEAAIFGDFSNSMFYILAVFNGILICLPNLDNKLYRLFLFAGRSITFAYTFYFFLVFLPFLPLSVTTIIAVGTGFLMLTPLLLFVIHINEISKDFKYLQAWFSKRLIAGMTALGFLVIPVFITATYLKDKSILNETLGYLYSPDYSKKYDIDRSSLLKTLNVVRQHKDRNRDFIFSNQTPYLSAYFNWLVFNNLTLSNAKINYIEKIFFGHASLKSESENIQNRNVNITNISTNSVYDKSQNAWKSWVDLEITNRSENVQFAEYAATFNLPEGCWISDYYLYVEDKKEPGILSEKKAAMWVFSSIRNENQDPGILYYLTGNKVAFRVFPFSKNEVRKTGIEFLHKEPVRLTIDNNIIRLGGTEETEKKNIETEKKNIETENAIYVSTRQKQSLRAVQRKPYFHFLIDASLGKEKLSADFVRRIETVLASNPSLSENAQISFVNSYVNSFSLDSDKNWVEHYQSQTFEGGFYLDRAIKTALFNAYKNKSYPIIVVVTDNIQNAVLDKDFSDFKFTFPESNLFFNLDSNGILLAHSLIDAPARQLPDSIAYSFNKSVLEYKLSDNSTAYLPNNNEPGIIFKKDNFKVADTEIEEKNWQSALTMQAKWMSQTLYPKTSDKEWLKMVKHSFVSKVMTPVTSYLVVENEAQQAMLKKKQAQVLSGSKSLDLDEDTQRMSEPSLWILTILLGLVFLYRRFGRFG